ncbi:MAG: beta-N-acetylhexosaminidase [Anaerolineae bacterium]|nr:beta-N-acetylhexosaminidase [Anaerolineae bacterium]
MALTLQEKVGRMLHIGFDGLEPPDYVLDWLARGQIGGIVLFRRNIQDAAQVAQLVQTCRDAAPRPILVSIDQEGGRVVRLHKGFTESPGAMAIGATDSELIAEQVSTVLATELRALGITWVLAPVVDIAHNPDNAVIGTRALGNVTPRVRDLAVAEVRGFQKAGVAATAKHFPGHGNTPIDTHVKLAVVHGSLDFLWEHDLVPFRAAVEADVASVLVSHVKFEDLDHEHPSSLSPRVVRDLLRQEMGFDGVACTDCMEMNAIAQHYGPAESAVLAVLAGEDVIFFSHTQEYQQAAFDALVHAVQQGRLLEAQIDDSLRRIDTMIARYPVEPRPSLEVIRSREHLAVMRRAAEAAVAFDQPDSTIFPLRPEDGQHVGLVEFSSFMDTPALESGATTALVSLLKVQAPQIKSVSLPSKGFDEELAARARHLARESDVLVLATRNAHLWPQDKAFASELMWLAHKVILVCLADPYDADTLPGANMVIMTFGDSTPMLEAAVDVLLGRLHPQGKPPVPVMAG